MQAVAPEIETFDRRALSGTPEETVGIAQRAGELIASITAPDLTDLLGGEPALADAYELAPRCEPLEPSAAPTTTPTTSGPPPTAADGTDVSACADGTCQILVSDPVDVQVGGTLLQISVRSNGNVVVGQPGVRGGYSSAEIGGSGGMASFGSPGGPTIIVTVDGVGPGGAVLSISTEG